MERTHLLLIFVLLVFAIVNGSPTGSGTDNEDYGATITDEDVTDIDDDSEHLEKLPRYVPV